MPSRGTGTEHISPKSFLLELHKPCACMPSSQGACVASEGLFPALPKMVNEKSKETVACWMF